MSSCKSDYSARDPAVVASGHSFLAAVMHAIFKKHNITGPIGHSIKCRFYQPPKAPLEKFKKPARGILVNSWNALPLLWCQRVDARNLSVSERSTSVHRSYTH